MNATNMLTVINDTDIDVVSSDALVPNRHDTDVMVYSLPIKLEEAIVGTG